jgi:hypothetical protein
MSMAVNGHMSNCIHQDIKLVGSDDVMLGDISVMQMEKLDRGCLSSTLLSKLYILYQLPSLTKYSARPLDLSMF